jgi:CheY-like chemotaxis protein
VDFTAASGAVDFVIEDTGPGIRERDLQSIFEPFHRLDAGNARIPGVGLGLTITQRLADYLGASIRVSSKFGKGTQFTLSLPMSPTELELVKLSPAQLQQPDTADKRLRSIDALIAVVDDVDDIRASIAGLLEAVGATVVALESGKELISYLEDGKPAPDIVLLDMQMAGMDGYETANRLRSSGVEAPVIALTAAAFEGAREHCLAAGCDDYLSKPVEPARLYECAFSRSIIATAKSTATTRATRGASFTASVPGPVATSNTVSLDDAPSTAIARSVSSGSWPKNSSS